MTLNGVFYNATSTKKPTWNTYYPGNITPADSEDVTAFVCDDPMGLWIGNFDAALGANTPAAIAATIGATAGTGTSSGSTINGRSDVTLTQGTIAPLANSWRVLRVVEDPANSDMTAAFCSVVVVQNLNQIIKSSQILEKCILIIDMLDKNSIAKSLLDTESIEFLVGASKLSLFATK